MKSKDNVKMFGRLGGAVMKIGQLKKCQKVKITGYIGEMLQHKVNERTTASTNP